MRRATLNLSSEAPELTADFVEKANQDFPFYEKQAMQVGRMKAALKWNNVLLEAAMKGQLTGYLEALAIEQIAENESLYL